MLAGRSYTAENPENPWFPHHPPPREWWLPWLAEVVDRARLGELTEAEASRHGWHSAWRDQARVADTVRLGETLDFEQARRSMSIDGEPWTVDGIVRAEVGMLLPTVNWLGRLYNMLTFDIGAWDVLEVCAGRGVLGPIMSRRGIRWRCTDAAPVAEHVDRVDALQAVSDFARGGACKAVFLAFPPDTGGLDYHIAHEAGRWGVPTVVVRGQPLGKATGPDPFNDRRLVATSFFRRERLIYAPVTRGFGSVSAWLCRSRYGAAGPPARRTMPDPTDDDIDF